MTQHLQQQKNNEFSCRIEEEKIPQTRDTESLDVCGQQHRCKKVQQITKIRKKKVMCHNYLKTYYYRRGNISILKEMSRITSSDLSKCKHYNEDYC